MSWSGDMYFAYQMKAVRALELSETQKDSEEGDPSGLWRSEKELQEAEDGPRRLLSGERAPRGTAGVGGGKRTDLQEDLWEKHPGTQSSTAMSHLA
ncbi:hypothetical protein H920_04530 [Fukomys damarensis]|uniref:Uncharacterized protein n=1 Tax=Fukomys damarensis TaxID=885580 RepID=A0A091EF74_FUKDA|nr:hypothetical protein H920_04530 [Fukomys damarensis]